MQHSIRLAAWNLHTNLMGGAENIWFMPKREDAGKRSAMKDEMATAMGYNNLKRRLGLRDGVGITGELYSQVCATLRSECGKRR
jgi:hypothetical protein